MAVYMKELKINTPLSYFVKIVNFVGKFWAESRSASWPLVERQQPSREAATAVTETLQLMQNIAP